MDEKWARTIETEISKINFLLENLYAVSFKGHGLTASDVDDVAGEMCRQCEQNPGTSWGAQLSQAEMQQQQEMLSHRIAMFFSGVQHRLRTDQQ
ncbi:hypothetical protein PX699_13475 [Sphingobium sp. H39-3-25]|uniref:hypothetical protein n=1 Tax=Sphingobium arseniciresistens TaxID=3030834 RepID=UPI0023B9DC78|nr:hypothetical protein [Sphingobium arseniciresistens]